MEINYTKINELALRYAKHNNDYLLTDLYGELKQYVNKEVKKGVNRATAYGVIIPREDFESGFNLAVWEAAIGFDGRSNYIQRLRFFMKRREADVWRAYKITDIDGVKYTKARYISLDKVIHEGGCTLRDTLSNKETTTNVEELIHQLFIKKIFQDFEKLNMRYKKVIEMKYFGFTNEEIAKYFKEKEYNAKIRKLVQRARQAFLVFFLQVVRECI